MKGIPEIGTFPIAVFATTLADPLSSRSADASSVVTLSNCWKAPLLTDTRGMFLKLMGRSASLPVETPPTVEVGGKDNFGKYEST